MKLGIVVNVMDSDEAGATTYRLAADAINMGHEVWVMSTGHLAYNSDDTIGAFARTVPQGRYTSERFLDVFKGEKAIDQWITLDRVRTGDDIRSNIHAGGKLRRAELNDTMFQLAEMVRPRLVEDGMFLVGLDIVGDKLMEINVFSPGGLGSAQKFTKINFNKYVIEALARKTNYMQYYGRNFDNVDLCTL